jgi:prepilin-type N-terminal cleavage/methylation domain-containing protein
LWQNKINQIRKKAVMHLRKIDSKQSTEGFSLVEMLIAIAISSIVLASLLALLGYSLRSASQTQARVALQNEAKDVVNHIAGYIMEGNHVSYDESNHFLTIYKDEEEPESTPITDTTEYKLKKTEQYCYYLIDGNLYFKNIQKDGKARTDDEDDLKRHLLSDNVKLFSIEIEEDDRTVHIELELEDDNSSFDCKQDVYIRNTCKGGGVHDED